MANLKDRIHGLTNMSSTTYFDGLTSDGDGWTSSDRKDQNEVDNVVVEPSEAQ